MTTVALSKIDNGVAKGYSYGYDQLNRLVFMNQHTTTANPNNWNNTNIIAAYAESIAYDANGNILQYQRKGANNAAGPLDMDSLNYKYNRDVNGNIVNNRLNHVRDAVSNSNYTVDIDNQSSNNYTYDNIGNLKTDAAETISNINWTVYGKIKSVSKTGTTITYGYDPGGNRTYKNVVPSIADDIKSTWYIRDAQGNTLAVYSKTGDGAIKWNEQHLYGSSRLGMWNWDTIVPATPPVVGSNGTPIYDSLLCGSRTYELSNHLGNVLATISDKKIGIPLCPRNQPCIVDYYEAEVLSQNDYYPFGMLQPGRQYSAASGYRYGFNGKEKDNEVKGEGNQQDYGMRIYDPRLGRFLSVDPLMKEYPMLTSYQFASNTPIQAIDLDGTEGIRYDEIDEKGVLIRHVVEVKVYMVITNNMKSALTSNFSKDDLKIVQNNLNQDFNGSDGTGSENSKGEKVFFKFNIEIKEFNKGIKVNEDMLVQDAFNEKIESGTPFYSEKMVKRKGEHPKWKKIRENLLMDNKIVGFANAIPAHLILGFAGAYNYGSQTGTLVKVREQDKDNSGAYLHELLHFLLQYDKIEDHHTLGGGLDNPPGTLTAENVDKILEYSPESKDPKRVVTEKSKEKPDEKNKENKKKPSL
jgi:RHS repeat-associated protein